MHDVNALEGFLRDCVYAAKCGYYQWRIARLERKLEQRRIKELNLKMRAQGSLR